MIWLFLPLFFVSVFNLVFSEDLSSLVRKYDEAGRIEFSRHYGITESFDDVGAFFNFNRSKIDRELWFNPWNLPADFYPDESWARLCSGFMFNRCNTRFFPYIQKIIVDNPYSRVAFIGDLHDNLDNLIAYLKELQRQGYLDENYKICGNNFYVVFLGDYVDRNPRYEKREILNFLIKFYNENLGKIFMLRGNHDTYDFQMRNKKEIIENDIWINFFEMLPVALFIAVRGVDETINFVQCCHGGIEPGFEVKSFLQSSASFRRILSIRRRNVCCEFLDNLSIESFADGHYLFKDFIVQRNLSLGLISLGFVWGDFEIDSERKGLNISNVRGETFIHGENVTENYLKESSSSSIKLLKIIRGHQHSGNLFRASLLPNYMCSNLWDGKVYTLISYFDNVRSFMIWQTDSDPNDWRFVHHYTVIKDGEFLKKEV